MIKDGRILENFSSKDKIAAFPISNGKMFVISFFKEIACVEIRRWWLLNCVESMKFSNTILKNVRKNNYRV